MSISPFQFAWQWKTGMYQYKIFWVFNGKRTSSFLSETFSWQHGRIASCTSLINCFPWAAKLAWDKRQHRQHLIFPMRWLRFWHFATLHGLEDLPVLVIWVLLRSAPFLSLMMATAAQRSRVFVPHLYCGLAGSSRTSRTIKPLFWILFDKASVFMDLCTGTEQQQLPLETNVTKKMAPTFPHKLQRIQPASGHNVTIRSDGSGTRTGYPFVAYTWANFWDFFMA